MSLNSTEIDIILDELHLEGCIVDDIVQSGYDTIALRLHGCVFNMLLICIASGECRLCGTRRAIRRNDAPLRFMECLRHNIRGAKIMRAVQLGDDRIVHITLKRGEAALALYIRLWSNAANVVLCTMDGTVIDAMHRRPQKGELSGGHITLPKPHGGADTAYPPRPARNFSEAAPSGGADTFLSYNERVDLWYAENGASLSRTALLDKANKWYEAEVKRLNAALSALQARLSALQDAGRYRHTGDLILSNAHLFPCRGGRADLVCTDYETGEEVHIKVDTMKTPPENAESYYALYRKAQSGAAKAMHGIAAVKSSLQAVQSRYDDIVQCCDPTAMEQCLRAARCPREHFHKKRPGVAYEVAGCLIMVGRNAKENDELLRHHARGNDLWLHTRDCPGGFVIIRAPYVKGNGGSDALPREVLLDAATLAVYHSNARKAGRAELYCTHVKYLRRVKGGAAGKVIPTHEKDIMAVMEQSRLDALDACKVQ